MPETVPGQRITAAERRAQVFELRRRRATFDQIGRTLGISKQRAYEIYRKALAEIPAADLEEHRAEELILIDDAVRALLVICHDPRVSARSRIEAWNAVRGWAERKARLLGLDAPAKQRIEVISQDVLDRAIAELEAELGPAETWPESRTQ